MTLTEAIDLAMQVTHSQRPICFFDPLCLQVLKQVMEEKLTGQNVEMSTVSKETEKFKMFTPAVLSPHCTTMY